MENKAALMPPIALSLGHPRFPEEAAAGDTVHAWRSLIARVGPAEAAVRVEGDFAVAITLDDGSVFLAVDRYAIRTLCWRIDAGRLICSERADGLGSKTLDNQAVFDYLYFHVVPSPRTVFAGVQRLPPAHWALFKDGRLTQHRYWTPKFDPLRDPSFERLRDEFRVLLKNAVARQLDGSRPACYLSGGTDSSTVAGMIGLAAGRPAVAYSIGFDAKGYDEMAYARMAAKHFGCEHREIYFTPEDLVRDIPKVAAGYDQPFGNSSALPAFHCAERARADGITRLLAGDGGDELFGGNSRYATQRLFEPYARIPSFIRRGFLEPFFGHGLVSRLPGLRKGSNYIRLANLPMPVRGQDYNHVRRIGESTVLTSAFLASIDIADTDRQQRVVWAEADCNNEIDRHLAYDWRYTLAECDLPKVVGTATMAGVSVGFPLLDDALVNFSMRLPAEYKLRGDALRWFFKEALRGFLPDGVITKKKQGFGLPFGVWMVQHEGLKRLSTDAVSSLVSRGIVRPEFGRELFDGLLPSHPQHYGTMAWILIMLEYWLRAHTPDWRIKE
ncbi:MAG: asparagine synthase [Burkholderiales bacterium]|nr:asparagine synthase [Burkholderiales bacterium]MDE1925772.1 asparagine synthase [Burkholderiales bacterium]